MKVLCIAIGNSLRGDDGVAHRIAAGIEPGEEVSVRSVQQLTPELAVDVAEAATVIFIDADIEANEIVIEPVHSGQIKRTPLAHSLRPSEVVWLARRLYGFTGSAYLCRVPAESFEGDALTATAEIAANGALVLLRERIRGHVDRIAGPVRNSTAAPTLQTMDPGEPPPAALLPDRATCPACLSEIGDPEQGRDGYPFTNCAVCGPRYSTRLEIPYERRNTTMQAFIPCPECLSEHANPDRHFKAQPVACPSCGPQLSDPLDTAVEALGRGEIIALKSLGGFQLLCDARNFDSVARLRERKQSDEKPYPVMMPDLAAVRRYCRLSPREEALLTSPAAPVVLLDPLASDLAQNVAGSSPSLAVMLPHSPLHHLLLRAWPHPVVATGANRGEEPVATGNEEARERLRGIADMFLLHDRPIARACDDSVARVIGGRPELIRRSRGYVPLAVEVPAALPRVLAVGGQRKNTIAIAIGRRVVLSQDLGDLETAAARAGFRSAIQDLCRLHRFEPEMVVCDLNPDYSSTAWARASGLPVIPVQHHHAHAAACAAENGIRGPYLAAVWDESGYGLDGSLWGGEIFAVSEGRFDRVAHLRPFRLPGGEAAMRDGWRAAASLLCQTLGPEALRPDTPQRESIARMIAQGVNAPFTTSVGLLFGAAASLAGVASASRFEEEAAMLLERAIGSVRTSHAYSLPEGDWRPLVAGTLEDLAQGVGPGVMAAKFHNALVEWLARAARQAGIGQVVLTGGVFQNRYLLERGVEILEGHGFRVFTHHAVPSNDGGISLGQAVLAAGAGRETTAIDGKG